MNISTASEFAAQPLTGALASHQASNEQAKDSHDENSLSTDTVTISEEGQNRLAAASESQADPGQTPPNQGDENSVTAEQLTDEEKQQVTEMKQRDREVRQHEQAHAGSAKSGSIQFDFERGPDGNNYAIGGHVNIDTGKESTPQATIAKMKQVQKAALAPTEPSGQDRAVAAKAAATLAEAQKELATEQQEKGQGQYSATGAFTPTNDTQQGELGSLLSVVA